MVRVEVALSCGCGEKLGAILGHLLSKANPAYEGPKTFVSPLAFRCSSCRKTTELLDTDTATTASSERSRGSVE